ncbi:MAG: PIN domain-containing protein, partial [Alphaproteobacteria bacterium]
DGPPETVRANTLAQGVREVPLTGALGISAACLGDFHGDPADRFIAATAMSLDATLLTADDRLLDWRGDLKTHDARR